MVRGLVDEQELRLANQRARDREAFLPAAGKRLGGPGFVREARLPHRHGDPPLGLVLVEVKVADGLAEDGAHRGPGCEDRVLRHVADPEAPAGGARPGRGLLQAGQDLQEGGLAGSVRAHEAHVVALEDTQREPLEKRRRAEGFRELLAGDQQLRHRRSDRRPGPPWRGASAA